MKKSVLKFPTYYVRNRRVYLGLTQEEVSKAIGVKWPAYQKLEQRGSIVEEHIPALAKVLQVSEQELWIEKMAPMVFKIFSISQAKFVDFVKSCPKVSQRLGNEG